MNRKFLSKISSIIMIFTVLALSCKEKEENITAGDVQDLSEESEVDSYYQDMDDMSGVVIEAPEDNEYAGGRQKATYQITVNDYRFNCSGVKVTLTTDPASTSTNPKGKIEVDFGTGCTDLKGNVRSGKLIFTYSGKRFATGSSIVTTTDNYKFNGVKLEGTRTTTVTGSSNTSTSFRVVLANGKATFDDGRIAERTSDLSLEWIRVANPLNDELIIKQVSTANGKSREGRTYTLTLMEDLKYKRLCGIAIDGIKKYVIDGKKEVLVDYGSGDCDRTITISFNGFTRTITI
jgi:hypothetical protein